MKLTRSRQPSPVDPAIAEFVGAAYFALEDNLERCGRLAGLRESGASSDEIRPEALAGARRIAYVSRMTWEAITSGFDPESVPQDLLPFQAFGALARLGYALVGLAEDDPEPEQLLSQAELDALTAQYGIEDWVEKCRTRTFSAPEDGR